MSDLKIIKNKFTGSIFKSRFFIWDHEADPKKEQTVESDIEKQAKLDKIGQLQNQIENYKAKFSDLFGLCRLENATNDDQAKKDYKDLGYDNPNNPKTVLFDQAFKQVDQNRGLMALMGYKISPKLDTYLVRAGILMQITDVGYTVRNLLNWSEEKKASGDLAGCIENLESAINKYKQLEKFQTMLSLMRMETPVPMMSLPKNRSASTPDGKNIDYSLLTNNEYETILSTISGVEKANQLLVARDRINTRVGSLINNGYLTQEQVNNMFQPMLSYHGEAPRLMEMYDSINADLNRIEKDKRTASADEYLDKNLSA